MQLTEKETLERVLFLLKRMWIHDHDGSELFPVPEKFWVSENHFDWEKVTEQRQHLRHHIKTDPSQSLLFDVMHQEIFPLIEKALNN